MFTTRSLQTFFYHVANHKEGCAMYTCPSLQFLSSHIIDPHEGHNCSSLVVVIHHRVYDTALALS